MLHTTFRKARKAKACIASYKKIAKALGGIGKYGRDTPIPLDKILEVCGLQDALWSLRIVLEPADREIRLLACDYTERVLPLFEKEFPEDRRPRRAIEVTRLFADGQATKDELGAAAKAAKAAVAAAETAAWAAAETAKATWTANVAVWTAADVAAEAAWAAKAAAWAAAITTEAAAWAITWAADTAAWVATEATEREWQKQRLLDMLNAF